MLHDCDGTEVVVVDADVEVVLADVVVVRGGGFLEPRTSAPGLRTSNAAQRARRPVTAAQTALVRTATAGFPAEVGSGAAPPASAATTPPPTTTTSARPALHNLR